MLHCTNLFTQTPLERPVGSVSVGLHNQSCTVNTPATSVRENRGRPAGGGRAVASGAEAVSALPGIHPCREDCGVGRGRNEFILSLTFEAIAVLAPSTPQERRAPPALRPQMG
jgi:hypothetical protein